ncbi:CdaR family protein [uncultured Draconibacterium sp.]|uniref:CdaR family protein n=1 Tax=uncultured Draconibacterium sp. TaxID=1573823 RepID=UPI002AA704CF|nr:CdaR family protein [uncultured Draconibacterium sp.]
MKKNIEKISSYLKVEQLKNDKRVVVFLVCVFIATVLWFLNALEKDYTTTIAYPVRYVSPPNHQFLANTPPEKLDLKVEAHGFTLLRHKLSFAYSPIVLNLSNITRNLESNNGVYFVPTNTLQRRISSQISNEISLQQISPDIIRIALDSLKTKTVKVKADVSVNFKPQFNRKSPVKLEPEVVKITGPASTVDTIRFLQTEKRSFDNVDATINRNIKLLHPETTTLVPQEVLLQIEVEKYTEKQLKLPIQVVNKPADVSIKLFPSELTLNCMVGLSEFDNISAANFRAVIDYSSISDNESRLSVKIATKPSFVEITRYTPESVEYLIETY